MPPGPNRFQLATKKIRDRETSGLLGSWALRVQATFPDTNSLPPFSVAGHRPRGQRRERGSQHFQPGRLLEPDPGVRPRNGHPETDGGVQVRLQPGLPDGEVVHLHADRSQNDAVRRAVPGVHQVGTHSYSPAVTVFFKFSCWYRSLLQSYFHLVCLQSFAVRHCCYREQALAPSLSADTNAVCKKWQMILKRLFPTSKCLQLECQSKSRYKKGSSVPTLLLGRKVEPHIAAVELLCLVAYEVASQPRSDC